jgi:L-asparaginase
MIKLITCGGTIDKVYFDDLSDYKVGESTVPPILSSMGVEFVHCPLCQKDSLEITEEEREAIAIEASQTSHDVLLTHGTDTMVETAQAIAKLHEGHNAVVLTGAMSPALFKDTDAVFNIGFALGMIKMMRCANWNEVFIAMNGRLFHPYNVFKNRDEQRFEILK